MRTYQRTNQIIQGNWDRPFATSIPTLTLPFVGDTDNKLYSQNFIIKKDKYPRFIPTNGDTWSEDRSFYWLKDDNFQDLFGGYLTYTRHWGVLPGFNGNTNTQRKEFGSMVWTKPGLTTEDLGFILYFIDSNKLVYANGLAYLYTTAATPHNLDDTKYKFAQVQYQVVDGSGQTLGRTRMVEIVARGVDWIAIPIIVDGVGGSIYYNWFSKPQLNREPRQVVVPFIDYIDYWMPGVNCDSPEDIPIIQQWSIIDSLGNETDYLSENSHPPLWDNDGNGETGYYTMVANKEPIAVEPSIINRWGFGGDIYERRVKYIVIV